MRMGPTPPGKPGVAIPGQLGGITVLPGVHIPGVIGWGIPTLIGYPPIEYGFPSVKPRGVPVGIWLFMGKCPLLLASLRLGAMCAGSMT